MADTEKLEKITSRTSLKRVAEDIEIVLVIVFLAMEKTSFVNGQNIIVDGGATVAIL